MGLREVSRKMAMALGYKGSCLACGYEGVYYKPFMDFTFYQSAPPAEVEYCGELAEYAHQCVNQHACDARREMNKLTGKEDCDV